LKYLAERLLHSIFLLVGVSILSFAFSELAPGDYYSELQNDPLVSGDAIVRLRARAGLDRPLPVRYAAWAGSVLRGDFGYSLAYDGPVGPLLWPRIRATLLLTGAATLFAWLSAIPLGVWIATQRRRWAAGVSRAVLALLLTIPDLLLAIVLLVMAVETGWFPTGGMNSPGRAGMSDVLWHMVLPVAVLALGMLPILVRHVRASVGEAMDSPFALSGRAHGIGRWRLLFRHILPAAMNPLVSLFGLSLGTLLSASLLVEVVMGWPGLGPLFLDAIMARDFALVLAVVMLSTTFLVAGNLVADLLLYRLDPRIRVR
jgi:peptide/nickel transport system permease protein